MATWIEPPAEDDPPLDALFRNDGGNAHHWLSIKTTGAQSNRDGIGARLKVQAGGQVQVQEVRSGRSYLSASDPRIHFGLGEHAQADLLEITWPSGLSERFENLGADQFIEVREGEGLFPYRPGQRR